MTAPPPVTSGLRRRAAALTGDRLVRTSWPLLLNTGSNALLGVLFWMMAARLYDQTTVGTNMAVIAAMTTMSGITQLNLGPSLGVLVPRAGERGRLVVFQVYVVVTAYAVVALAVFYAFLLPHFDQLHQVLGSASRMWPFGLAVIAFNIFALQDAALVSLRRAMVIPLENLAFGVAKLVLLIVLVQRLPTFGIFSSWLIPILVIVPAISGLIFLRPTKRDASPLPEISARASVPKLALDYVGYLFQVCSTFFLPVVALELLDPIAASVFAVAWLTSSTMDLLATNIGTALIVETSYGMDPAVLRRTLFRRVMPIVAGVTLLGMAATPVVIRLYGAEYTADGIPTLLLLLLASVPRSLVTFAIAESRAHRNIGVIVWLRAQNAVLVLGLSYVLTPYFGVEGIALSWLIAQLAGALTALRTVFRRKVGSLKGET
ncbi:MAG: lipopolysaccharide biosynthesis protein [Nocardioidaceae bacterium]